MKTILVTGSAGFIGRHLVEALGRAQGVRVMGYDIGSPVEEFHQRLAEADCIFHLAGVNRPQNPEDFRTVNTGLTREICAELERVGRAPLVVLASSIQAMQDNPYGKSKKGAEEELRGWSERSGGRVVVFRLKNIFGKWCRPNYNSVTATFCHNIAQGLPITISDPNKELEVVYIDDVIAGLVEVAHTAPSEPFGYREVARSFKVTLGGLASRIRSFRESRESLMQPSFGDEFTRCLYATYLSYLDGADFSYGLQVRKDARGELAEFMKSAQFGQIFVSRTRPGATRGNHYHHTKTEKFFVVEGEAVIRLRRVRPGDGASAGGGTENGASAGGGTGPEVIEYRVSGRDFRVVDIPPGYSHSIENVGDTEMVVLFWASEIFEPERPDTYPMEVKS